MRFKKLGLIALAMFMSACDLNETTPSVTANNATVPSHLKKASFSDLPGWQDDDVRYALRAFRNTCQAKVQYSGKIVPDKYLLEEKCQFLPAESADVAVVRAWFESHFQPYRLSDESGKTAGTFTGYYSPTIDGCRTKTAVCNEPLMAPPAGMSYKGVPKKTIVEKNMGRVLYWANLVDVQNIQIQGSGMLRLEDGTLVKLNFAGVNDMQFNGPGDQLRKRGIKPDGGYSADAVWKHLKANPTLAREIIYNNPRYVYFAESTSHDVIGKMGVPLSKIRSIAIDDSIYTLGLPVYVDTNLSNGRKFRRLMIAQDTGGAIRGWVRGDIFFGLGDEAYQYAHGQHAAGSAYILMPKPYKYIKPRY